MTTKRYFDQIVAILNGRPDIRHPLYDLRLSDAITIALDKLHIRFEPLDSLATLEQVRDALCENYPNHTWITGEAAIELLDSVLSVAPTHYLAKIGGRPITVRLATLADVGLAHDSSGARFTHDRFVELATGRVIPSQPDDLALIRGLRVTSPVFVCSNGAEELAPDALIALLTEYAPPDEQSGDLPTQSQ